VVVRDGGGIEDDTEFRQGANESIVNNPPVALFSGPGVEINEAPFSEPASGREEITKFPGDVHCAYFPTSSIAGGRAFDLGPRPSQETISPQAKFSW